MPLDSALNGGEAGPPRATNRRNAGSRGVRNASVWARVEQAASTSGPTGRASEPANPRFPPLPEPRAPAALHLPRGATPWTSSARSAADPPPTVRPIARPAAGPAARPAPVQFVDPARAEPLPHNRDFPSLPTSLEGAQRAARLRAALTPRSGETTPTTAPVQITPWGTSAVGRSEPPAHASALATADTEENGPCPGGKKKKKKQLLLYHGAL